MKEKIIIAVVTSLVGLVVYIATSEYDYYKHKRELKAEELKKEEVKDYAYKLDSLARVFNDNSIILKTQNDSLKNVLNNVLKVNNKITLDMEKVVNEDLYNVQSLDSIKASLYAY